MRRLVFTLLASCAYDPSPADPGGDGPNASDAPGNACAWGFAPTGIDPCTAPQPTSELELCTPGTYVYDTTDNTMTGAPTPATAIIGGVRIVALQRMEICNGQRLQIIGTMPVVVLVYGEVRIDGSLDASAWFDTNTWQQGPGGDLCGTGNGGGGGASSDGANGGAGGGFGKVGGDGGSSEGGPATAGGRAEGDALLAPIRGGCRGGAGGDGDSSGSGGRAGPGGGGLQLAARDAMTIIGSVRANGGPGIGGKTSDAGGGGGGAGGGILLESPTLTIGGTVCANGGGGGGGASDGGPLIPGGDGAPGTCGLSAASAGSGSNNGRPGGAGGFGTAEAGNGSGADEGSGGGGGAVGRIRLRSAASSITGTITPPAS